MNFQQFQQSKRELIAVYDQSNILAGVGDLDCYRSSTETWFWVDGVDYCPAEDLKSVYFYSDFGLYIERLIGDEYVLNLESETVSGDLEMLERMLYFYACGENYLGEDLMEEEITRCKIIEECERINPSGCYRDSACIADGIEPMGLHEAFVQFARLLK
jgi:hypothetical protein